MKKPKRLFKNRTPVTSVRRDRPSYDPNNPTFIAMHEAGHAVANVVFGVAFRSVDIKRRRLPDGTISMGLTDCPAVSDTDVAGQPDDIVVPHMIRCLTGPFAESQVNDRIHQCNGHDLDVQQARTIAMMARCNLPKLDNPTGQKREIMLVIPPEEIERTEPQLKSLMSQATERAIALVEEYWLAIGAVADSLLERTSLTGEEVVAIVREHQAESAAG